MRCYMDYAATSAIRPRRVIAAVAGFLESCGATPGRGGHSAAVEASRTALRCRRGLMDVLGLEGDPGRIAFMQNATHALNTALDGILERGDTVVVTAFDHNAVLRPAHRLSRQRGVEVRMVGVSPEGEVDPAEVRRALEGARLLVVNAASNVLGSLLPAADLAGWAHEAGALVLVDAAQSAGHVAGSHADQGADLIAFTGHKGLLGPQGTGGLWVGPGVDLAPLLTGGTGGDSMSREMPSSLPDRLEAGTVNAPGIAGLAAACEYLIEEGVETIQGRESRLKARLREGLESIPSIRVLSPPAPDGIAVVTVVCDRLDPATLADRLDREFGVATRSGLHCAPEVHRLLGTVGTGALRFSLGWATTGEEVDYALEAVARSVHVSATPVG